MKNGTIYFSGMICYLNDFKLSIDEFKDNIKDDVVSEEKGNSVYIFNLKYVNDFLTINFSDGSSMPRNPKIYDQKTHSLEDNPRNKNQIEPKDYFAIIDFETSFLWLNNTKKKSLLLSFLQSYFKNKAIVLKDIYDEQEFIETLATLDGLKISAVPANIFAQTNTTSKALNDEMYLASKAELSLTYDKIRIVDKLKDKIFNILQNRESFQNIYNIRARRKRFGYVF